MCSVLPLLPLEEGVGEEGLERRLPYVNEIDQSFYFAPSALNSLERSYLSRGDAPGFYISGLWPLALLQDFRSGKSNCIGLCSRIPFSSCATVVYNGRSCRLTTPGSRSPRLKTLDSYSDETNQHGSSGLRWRALSLLAFAELLGMSLWFSGSAVVPALKTAWKLGDATVSWLTLAVQIGFVFGTLLSALLNLPDILRSRYLFAMTALAGAATKAIFGVYAPGPKLAIAF